MQGGGVRFALELGPDRRVPAGDLERIHGNGKDGRILLGDVKEHLSSGSDSSQKGEGKGKGKGPASATWKGKVDSESESDSESDSGGEE